MSSGDTLVDQGADRLRDLSERAAEHGGVTSKLAQPLAEDSDFLRKLKPSLIKARAKGRAPKNQKPGHGTVGSTGAKPKRPGSGGPSPFLFVGLAFAAGIVLAKIIDWKNDANPD
jgi:hypothetical protein